MADKKIVTGRAKGGIARATSLTPEERSAIAKRAAEKRWLPKATHQGVLTIGGTEIPCFVLDDGRRVISGRSLTAAIGMKGRGQGVSRISEHRLVRGEANAALIDAIERPIKFDGFSPKAAPSDGYEATVLQELCEALLDARQHGSIRTEQEERYVKYAETLIRAFAKVGIVALVDEATGYQDVRPQNALQHYLEMLVRKDLAAWVKRFPDEFYENIYKLKSWPWQGMGVNRYSVVAKYTTDLVYDRLGPGVLDELQRKSPRNDRGQRKNKLHQWLTDDVGHPMLAQHMHSLIMFQRLAIKNKAGWDGFKKMVDQVLPKKGSTLELPGLDAPERKR